MQLSDLFPFVIRLCPTSWQESSTNSHFQSNELNFLDGIVLSLNVSLSDVQLKNWQRLCLWIYRENPFQQYLALLLFPLRSYTRARLYSCSSSSFVSLLLRDSWYLFKLPISNSFPLLISFNSFARSWILEIYTAGVPLYPKTTPKDLTGMYSDRNRISNSHSLSIELSTVLRQDTQHSAPLCTSWPVRSLRTT